VLARSAAGLDRAADRAGPSARVSRMPGTARLRIGLRAGRPRARGSRPGRPPGSPVWRMRWPASAVPGRDSEELHRDGAAVEDARSSAHRTNEGDERSPAFPSASSSETSAPRRREDELEDLASRLALAGDRTFARGDRPPARRSTHESRRRRPCLRESLRPCSACPSGKSARQRKGPGSPRERVPPAAREVPAGATREGGGVARASDRAGAATPPRWRSLAGGARSSGAPGQAPAPGSPPSGSEDESFVFTWSAARRPPRDARRSLSPQTAAGSGSSRVR
jgi:hypothetical protein